jgi:hypothetical protein
MYIENKSEGLEGSACIGRVYFSKTGKTLYYRGKKFRSLKGSGFKANYFDICTGEEYWISGPRKDDGQLGREVAKLAAQFEAPINFCSQTNINNGQIWKAGTKGLTRSLLRFVVFYVIPMSLKRVAVVFRNGVLVLDNAN